MGNIWSWLCNSSNKKTIQEDEGSYKKTENGIAEKVTTTVEEPNSTKLEVLQSDDEKENSVLSETGDRLDLSLNNVTVELGKPNEYGDLNASSLSFSTDERLPTFVTVPSPTQVTKLQDSVRA